MAEAEHPIERKVRQHAWNLAGKGEFTGRRVRDDGTQVGIKLMYIAPTSVFGTWRKAFEAVLTYFLGISRADTRSVICSSASILYLIPYRVLIA